MKVAVQFFDSEVEKAVLKLLTETPCHTSIPGLDPSVFYVEEHKQLFNLLRKYFLEYRKPLSPDVFDAFLSCVDLRDELRASISLLYQEIQDIDASKDQFEFFKKRLNTLKLGRDLKSLYTSLGDNLSSQKPFDKLLSDLTSQVLSLTGAFFKTEITRAYLWEDVKERWHEYLSKERNPEQLAGMSYGIEELDELTGGVRKSHLILFYGKTGSGKSRLLANIALNLSFANFHVMYFSLEMNRSLLAKCLDSRNTLIDFYLLDKGKLDSEQKEKFFSYLKSQAEQKPPFYIVDAPVVLRPSDIGREIELYRHTKGVSPDVVVIDYANLMDSDRSYSGGRSEKYDQIFQDLHLLARYYDVAILTASQERRAPPGRKLSSDERDLAGVEKIAVSNFMATHCEFVAHLNRDELDAIENTLRLDIEKNRYGKAGHSITLFAAWAYNYIGSRHLKLKGNYL